MQGQAALGADVRVVVVNHRDDKGKDVTFRKFRRTLTVNECDENVRVMRIGRVACLAKLDLAPGLINAIRIISKDPPDIWHLHTPNVTMMLAVASLPIVKPIVITHHSDIIRQRVLKHILSPLERMIYSRADCILATSSQYIEGSKLLQRFEKKVVSLPLGINLDQFKNPSPNAMACAEAFRTKYPGPIWLCVGRLIYYKGFDIAIRALADVPGNLLLIGTGPMKQELEILAEKCGVKNRVHWLGWASGDQLVGAYQAARALWFPSNARSEAFGLVQVEAMASRCPVINTAIPASGVSWVSPDEVSGITVPVNNHLAFANAANRLAMDDELYKKLSDEGYNRATEEFCYSKMAQRSLDVYSQIIKLTSES